MIREKFEESKETLCEEVMDTILLHFERLNLRFDLEEFTKRNANFLDHVVCEAHFIGAEVFPVDIPTKA